MQSYIVQDVETNGLNFQKNLIMEIAWICLDGSEGGELKEVSRYTTLIKPYDTKNLGNYDPIALKVHGITVAETEKNGVSYKDVIKALKKDCEKLTKPIGRGGKLKPILVGHNYSSFDYSFVEYLFQLDGQYLFDYTDEFIYDTLRMSRSKWPNEKKHGLKAACKLAGIDLVDAHRAEADIEANAELFKYFMSSLRGEGVSKVQEKSRFRESFKF